MSMLVWHKLLGIFAVVALGWAAGRLRWLGPSSGGTDPARVLGQVAFAIFVPALLFRTAARLDLAALPWATLAAFFVPVLLVVLVVYALQRLRQPAGGVDAAAPSARAIAVGFGNSVQVGIPLAAALFGDVGLGIHIAIVSLHALVLLSVLTALVELDLARAAPGSQAGLWHTLRGTLRNTLIHPVVLPVLAGLTWNLAGWPLPGAIDETLKLLGTAVAPVCLLLIGLSLAYAPIGGAVGGAARITLLKLLVLPAVVLGMARWGFGLSGLPLQVVVMMAALPTGANALLFAQRYRSGEAEASTAIVLSTLCFALTAPLWLAVLARLA